MITKPRSGLLTSEIFIMVWNSMPTCRMSRCYQQADGWLLDPLNPHSIAATRQLYLHPVYHHVAGTVFAGFCGF